MSNGKAKAPRPGVGRREEEAKAASQIQTERKVEDFNMAGILTDSTPARELDRTACRYAINKHCKSDQPKEV